MILLSPLKQLWKDYHDLQYSAIDLLRQSVGDMKVIIDDEVEFEDDANNTVYGFDKDNVYINSELTNSYPTDELSIEDALSLIDYIPVE